MQTYRLAQDNEGEALLKAVERGGTTYHIQARDWVDTGAGRGGALHERPHSHPARPI